MSTTKSSENRSSDEAHTPTSSKSHEEEEEEQADEEQPEHEPSPEPEEGQEEKEDEENEEEEAENFFDESELTKQQRKVYKYADLMHKKMEKHNGKSPEEIFHEYLLIEFDLNKYYGFIDDEEYTLETLHKLFDMLKTYCYSLTERIENFNDEDLVKGIEFSESHCNASLIYKSTT